MGKKLQRLLSIGLFCGWAATAWAGPGHQEIDDAGGRRPTAQTTVGDGELGTIEGSLDGPRGLPSDLEDMYLFRIADPSIFTARTDINFGPTGMTNFDTQLFLFELDPDPLNQDDAFGLLGNDELADGEPGPSFIGNIANDGTLAQVTDPGLYLLAISGAGRVPISNAGLIFNQESPSEISGPDGPGGLDPHVDWTGPGQLGQYTIFLTGAEFAESPIPTLNQWSLIAMGALLLVTGGVLIRRRRVIPMPVRVGSRP